MVRCDNFAGVAESLHKEWSKPLKLAMKIRKYCKQLSIRRLLQISTTTANETSCCAQNDNRIVAPPSIFSGVVRHIHHADEVTLSTSSADISLRTHYINMDASSSSGCETTITLVNHKLSSEIITANQNVDQPSWVWQVLAGPWMHPVPARHHFWTAGVSCQYRYFVLSKVYACFRLY